MVSNGEVYDFTLVINVLKHDSQIVWLIVNGNQLQYNTYVHEYQVYMVDIHVMMVRIVIIHIITIYGQLALLKPLTIKCTRYHAHQTLKTYVFFWVGQTRYEGYESIGHAK